MINKKIVYENNTYKIKDTDNYYLVSALEAFSDFMSLIELILKEYEDYKINGLQNLNIEIYYDKNFKNIRFNLNFRYFNVNLEKINYDINGVFLESDDSLTITLDKDYNIYYKDGQLKGTFVKRLINQIQSFFNIEYEDGTYKDYTTLIKMSRF